MKAAEASKGADYGKVNMWEETSGAGLFADSSGAIPGLKRGCLQSKNLYPAFRQNRGILFLLSLLLNCLQL